MILIPKICLSSLLILSSGGLSGGAMGLSNLPVLGRPTIWMVVGHGPTALAVGAGRGCLDIFTLRPRARYGLPPPPGGVL